MTPARKYQIFVSSTYEDLREQRSIVINAILQMGHIPVGMEMFSAANETQWNLIKKNIEQCDYHIVLIGRRYGSTTDDGISYTENEYDYAVAQGVPVLAFVLRESAPWSGLCTDTDPKPLASLRAFKAKVEKRLVSYWTRTEDLRGECSIALEKAIKEYPREGWSKGLGAVDTELVAQVTRLSEENADLRTRLEAQRLAEQQAQDEWLEKNFTILSNAKRRLYLWLKSSTDWEQRHEVTLLQLFYILSAELFIEKSTKDLARYIAHVVGKVSPKDLRWENPAPRNLVRDWMRDLSTLELVAISETRKPASSKNEYWTLTEKGRRFESYIRTKMLQRSSRGDATGCA